MRFNRSPIVSFFLAMMLVASTAFARWEFHRGANVKFEVPDFWVTSTQGNVLVTRTHQGDTAIEFVAVTSALQAANAERTLLGMVGARLQNARVTRPLRPVTQHGLSGFVLGGVGARNGRVIEWYSVVLGRGPQGILALVVGEAGMLEQRLPIVRPVLDSIQPIN